MMYRQLEAKRVERDRPTCIHETDKRGEKEIKRTEERYTDRSIDKRQTDLPGTGRPIHNRKQLLVRTQYHTSDLLSVGRQ
jgi:hypothetical protein